MLGMLCCHPTRLPTVFIDYAIPNTHISAHDHPFKFMSYVMRQAYVFIMNYDKFYCLGFRTTPFSTIGLFCKYCGLNVHSKDMLASHFSLFFLCLSN